MSMPNDDSTISSGSTSTSTTHKDFISLSPRDFIPGFPIESSIQPENSVKHTMGSRGQPTILIEPPFLDPVSETATTIPLPTHSISSDQPHTAPVFDSLRLLSPLEKDCPRLLSTSESSIRTFISSYNEYRRAGGTNCFYCINDLISIDVRKNLRTSSVQDPYALRSDEEWLSFLTLQLPKLETISAFALQYAKIVMKKDSSTPAHFKSFKEKFIKKTTDLYSSIESFPDQEELCGCLSRQFVQSIYPSHIRDQIFTPDRLRTLRGKTLAHYLKHFDTFVVALEKHLTFSLCLYPFPPSDSTTVTHKSTTPSNIVTAQPTPKVEKSHSRVASATVAPVVKSQCVPCDTPCPSCFVKGHVAVDCPTKQCGFCAAHQ
jgi:hypothetical protein